jgi:hypothetical protein
MNRTKRKKSNVVPIVGTEKRKFGSHDFYFGRQKGEKMER